MCGIYVSPASSIPSVGDINQLQPTMGISLSVLVGIGIYEVVQYRREKAKARNDAQPTSELNVKDEKNAREGQPRSRFGRIGLPFRHRRDKESVKCEIWQRGDEGENMGGSVLDLPPPYSPNVDMRMGRASGHFVGAKL